MHIYDKSSEIFRFFPNAPFLCAIDGHSILFLKTKPEGFSPSGFICKVIRSLHSVPSEDYTIL